VQKENLNMKRIFALIVLAMTLPVLAAAESWTNAALIDTECANKVKADPDAHTRACALACANGGFGIVDKDGNYLKFDAKGNAEALKLLQATTKKDHIRVNVTGEKDGDVIHVQSVKM
jgi:hypothetical protein